MCKTGQLRQIIWHSGFHTSFDRENQKQVEGFFFLTHCIVYCKFMLFAYQCLKYDMQCLEIISIYVFVSYMTHHGNVITCFQYAAFKLIRPTFTWNQYS